MENHGKHENTIKTIKTMKTTEKRRNEAHKGFFESRLDVALPATCKSFQSTYSIQINTLSVLDFFGAVLFFSCVAFPISFFGGLCGS